MNDPLFRNDSFNSWSGQPEGLTFQRAIRALENYGHYAEVSLIGRRLIKAIGSECRFPQQFDPFTGQPTSLGTDGFGRSESRESLRDFFEVDHRFVVLATLSALARQGQHRRGRRAGRHARPKH